jgi:hypothetical protein
MKQFAAFLFLFISFSTAKAQLAINVASTYSWGCNTIVYTNTTGGTAPYTYSDGGAFSTIDTFSFNTGGVYTITVMDATANTATTTVSVVTPQITGISIVPTTTGCSGSCFDVTIFGANTTTLNVTGLFSPNISVGIPFSECPTFNTTYTVTATDINGCTSSSIFVLNPSPVSVITAITTVTNGACSNNNSATIVGAGGTAPYIYMLGGTTSTTGIFNNLANGPHWYSVQDANGCFFQDSLLINNATAGPIVVCTAPPLACSASTTTATASVSGGVPPYNYSWNTVPPQLSSSATVGIGNYICTVTDANGCTESSFLNVLNASTNIGVTINNLQVPCPNNGSAIAIPTSGVAPYTYYWSSNPAQTTDVAVGLAAGTYTAIVTDANGCTGTAVTDLQTLTFLPVAARDSICPGDTTLLSATVNGNFGSTAMPTGYGTSAATSTQDDEILNVSIGTFSNSSTCTTTGGGAANGLPASSQNRYSNYTSLAPIPLTQGATLPISLTLGQCNTATAWSGSARVWIDFNQDGQLTATENVYTTPLGLNAPGGTVYNGTISIPNNAISGTTLMRIVFVESSIVNPTGSYTWGETEDYRVNIGYALQGTTTWAPNTGLNTTTGLQVIANPTTTTTYTVTTTDPNVCNTTSTITVTVNNGLVYSTAGISHVNVDCPLSTTGQISVTETGITNTISFLWNDSSTTATISNLGVGNYSVIVTDTAGGCVVLHDSVISLGLNCGDISGYVKYDSNNNCLYDPGETGIPNTMITVNPGNHITFTDANGDYAINGLPYNTYTITKSNALGYTNVCGNTTTGPINAAMPTLVGNYVDSSSLVYDYDLSAWGWCLAPALGNNHTNIYYNHNQAGQTSTGTIYAVFDSISHYGSSVPAHSSISGDTVFWNVTNIANGWFANHIDITWNLNPSLPMGLNIPLHIGIINTQHVDSVMSNNTHTLNYTTCTSYDPNEKYVVPQGKTNNGYITTADADLLYTVKFQNTGNATAANVVITDTISAFLDITKFHVLNASHPYSLEVVNNNVLKFKFLGIMLPDSNQDLEGSNGHITFGLKQLPNLAVGSVINNTANIYFDYNAPIVTGTTVNTIYKELQAAGNSSQANTACNVSCGNGKVTINGIDGIAPFTYSISPMCSTTTIVGNIVQNVPAGNYTTTITDALGKVVSNSASVQNNTATIAIASAVITPITSGTPGSISIVPTGGTAPYTYNWQPGNSTSSTLSTTVGGVYTCTITDANGCEKVVSYTIINNALGVSEITKATNLNLYPNPASTLLNIEASTALEQVRILNMVGKTIQIIEVGAARKTTIDIATLSAGVYQVQMSNGAVRKFVVGK